MMRMMTVMMSRGGRLVGLMCRGFVAGVVFVAGLGSVVWGQGVGGQGQGVIPRVRQAAVATPGGGVAAVETAVPGAGLGDVRSSLTVQQIVARQEAHFALIRNAQGTAVFKEVRFNEQGEVAASGTQYVYFVYEGDRSVTLVLPEKAVGVYRGSHGQVPWGDITAAHHVTGDTVYVIRKPEGGGTTTGPRVMAVPFNPMVHENNPLVSFHLRQVSDEQVALRDLARAIPGMAQRPVVRDVSYEGERMVRIDFGNPQVPGEELYYVIDPARGFLPVEIVRLSGGRPLSISRIVIGHTPDGTWIPARRERVMYDSAGRAASRQSWHYEYLAINRELAPRALSLMYFNLPLSTKVEVVGAERGSPVRPGAAGAAGAGRTTGGVQGEGQGQVVRPVATPVPTPVPTAAPTPMRVPL